MLWVKYWDYKTTALDAPFSIGFDKEIEHVQIIALNTSFPIGFDKEIEHI